MRIDLRATIQHAEDMLRGIECKSYHATAHYAHTCLATMASPIWAEEVPGMAKYYFGEYDAHQRLQALRRNVCVWMIALCDPTKSWEASDEWPKPQKLSDAVAALRELCPAESSVNQGTV